ncbi:MAG TPA: right-handed parallel beta-helix repeat-containing protein [Tepidisphaeraceae bacterium]|nr:right-handed parallel beta-helix repeat-containing protein [Tepidisphaeraceae bacterium]
MRSCLAFLLLIALASSAWADIFHIAQNAPNASDQNPGTAQQPWLTLARADRWVEAGDTVIIHAGVYRQTLLPGNSGTAAKPIIFEAAPGEKVIITGADVISNWQRVSGQIWAADWPYVFLIGGSDHHPDDDRDKISGRAEEVIVDGTVLRRQFLSVADMADVPGSFVADTSAHRLYIHLPDGSDPNRHLIEAAVRSAIVGQANEVHLDYITLRGLTFRYAANFPQLPAVTLGGRGDVIENCVIDAANGRGVDVGQQDAVMRNTIIENCGHTGGGAEGEHFLNENCVWVGNCWKNIDRGWDAGGFKFTESSDGIIEHCIFRKNGGPGLWLDAYDHDVTIRDNVFDQNELDGVEVEISHDITIENNLVERNGLGHHDYPDWSVGGLRLAESYHCTLSNNSVIGNRDGITLREQGPRLHGTAVYFNHDHVITQNVMADNAGYQLGFWYDNAFFGRHPAQMGEYPSDEALLDDLRQKAAAGLIPPSIYDPAKMHMTIDRNIYFAGPGEKLVLYGVPWRDRYREFDNLASFTLATGFAAHSIATDLHGAIRAPNAGATDNFEWYKEFLATDGAQINTDKFK